MKKIVVVVGIVVAFIAVAFLGLNAYINFTRPDFNTNERILSKGLDSDGKPSEILEETIVRREWGTVYVSLPANRKINVSCRVVISYGEETIEDIKVKPGESGYITYEFNELENRVPGMYMISFYDTKDELNAVVGVQVE